MTLQEFRDILKTTEVPVYHFEAFQERKAHYIIWQETGGRALAGSDTRQEGIRKIQVELYTSLEFDPALERLLQVLEESSVAFEEPVTDYDTDTKKIRHIIECEVIECPG